MSAAPTTLAQPRARARAAAALAAYLGALLALTWALPLWLDELLQLLVTRDPDSASRLAEIHRTPGAVPLGYEVQRLAIHWLGYSVFTARFPSEVASVLALAGLLLLAREIGTRGLVFVGVVWAVIPLLLRYAVEARPYSLALLFSIASTALLFRILRDPEARWVLLYAACVAAGLYTQPFSVFLQIGLLAPLVFERRTSAERRTLASCAASLLAGVLLLAPWVLSSSHNWRTYAHGMDEHFSLPGKLPLLLLRELSGGGYVCSLSLLAFVAMGCLSKRAAGLLKLQLLSGAACCIALALACDAVFNYFFAIRQVIPALVPLCLLAGEGWAEARTRWGTYPGLALLAVLVSGSLVKNVRHFRDHSEEWALAAQRLERSSRDGCVMYLPADMPGLYEFFAPDLKQERCGAAPAADNVLVPVTKYSVPAEIRLASDRLASRGYRAMEIQRVCEAIGIQRYQKGGPSGEPAPPRIIRE